MKQGIYLPPDVNEALRKTQSWQTFLVGFAFLLILELLMGGKALSFIIPLHVCLYSRVSKA